MSGNTAVMAVQVPGPVQGLDQVLAPDLAAGAETTSSKAQPRYRHIYVCLCVSSVLCVSYCSNILTVFLRKLLKDQYFGFFLSLLYIFGIVQLYSTTLYMSPQINSSPSLEGARHRFCTSRSVYSSWQEKNQKQKTCVTN